MENKKEIIVSKIYQILDKMNELAYKYHDEKKINSGQYASERSILSQRIMELIPEIGENIADGKLMFVYNTSNDKGKIIKSRYPLNVYIEEKKNLWAKPIYQFIPEKYNNKDVILSIRLLESKGDKNVLRR